VTGNAVVGWAAIDDAGVEHPAANVRRATKESGRTA
jgi:hypothetical protein